MRTPTRSGVAALSAASLLLPVGSAWAGALDRAAAHHPAAPAPHAAKHHAQASVVTRPVDYRGPSVDMRWGPVQVDLVVQGGRILDVKASYPTERARSQHINDIAVPMLREQVLRQQGIKGVYAISGATMTSEAYGQSLQAALAGAHITR